MSTRIHEPEPEETSWELTSWGLSRFSRSENGTVPLPNPGPDDAASDAHARAKLWSVLDVLYPRANQIERRTRHRYPYPNLIRLTPVDDDGSRHESEGIVVVGKHLSERGLGFYHPSPLPYRRMIASLETRGGRWLDFLIDLTWCRFKRQGWYESGGRFV